MSDRIDARRGPPRTETSQDDAPSELGSGKKTPAKPGGPAVTHTRASRQLAERSARPLRLPPTISIEPGTRDLNAPPVPDGSIPWLRLAPTPSAPPRSAPPPAPSAPPAGKPKAAPARAEAPLGFHLQAREKYDALVSDFEKTRAELDRAATSWDALAKQRRVAEATGAFGTMEDTAWHAERQALLARDLRRELTIEFGAAKHEYEVVLGLARGPAIGRPRPVDTSRDPAAPRPVHSELERLQAKIARYDQSVDGIKSSGVLAPPVAFAYVAAAELNGRELDRADYRRLDGIYQAGAIANVPVGVGTAYASSTRGAASPAPGVDHRGEGARHAAAESFHARNPPHRSR